MSVLRYSPSSRGAVAYRALGREFIERHVVQLATEENKLERTNEDAEGLGQGA
jgi:hypothetical protein